MRLGDVIRTIAWSVFFGLIAAAICVGPMVHERRGAHLTIAVPTLLPCAAGGVLLGVLVSWLHGKWIRTYWPPNKKPKITE